MRPTRPDIVVRLAALLLALCVAPGPARARLSSRVEKVKRLHDQLFFDDAMEVCQAVLDAGKNPRADVIELLRYKGLISAVQGKRAAAISAFKELLMVDPLARIGKEHPPRVQRAFAAARRWAKQQDPLMIAVTAPPGVPRKGVSEIRARITADPLGQVAHLVLNVRAGGRPSFRAMVVAPADGESRWTLDMGGIEGSDRAKALEYYVAALDRSFNELTLVGSAGGPRRIRLDGPPTPLVAAAPPVTRRRPAPPARPWYTRWWIWASAGAVLAATAVAIGVAASGPPDRVDAPITLEPRGSP